MDLSVVVVNWNTRDLLRACLDSIYQTVDDGFRFEVLVVDNHSSDGSPEMVAAEFPSVRQIRNLTNVGFAHANNQAITLSTGRYVLLLNSDAVLLPGTVSSMARSMETWPTVGIVGAQLLNPDGSFQFSFADFPSLAGELLLATRLAHLVSSTYPSYVTEQSQHERNCDWVSGACLMARRVAVDRVGLLDEDYFMYSEETDWCFRMRQAGWLTHYQPRARVIHWIGGSSKRVPERRRSMIYGSKLRFVRKHRSRPVAFGFHLALYLASALKLGWWRARTFRPDAEARALAEQHVRSYRLVLSELGRVSA